LKILFLDLKKLVLPIFKVYAKKLVCRLSAKIDMSSYLKTLKRPTRRLLRRETQNSTSISELSFRCVYFS